jgi:hypothetical protein
MNFWFGNSGTGSTATDTWNHWSDSSNYIITADIGTTAATGDSWIYWNDHTTSTGTSTALDDCWNRWVINAHASQPQAERYFREQREREQRRQREREQRYREQEVRLENARIESFALLDSILDDIQKKTFEEEDWFLVIGKSGRIYRLRRGRVGNIDLVSPDGRVLRSYCVHPNGSFPNGDDLVAQKLHLECDDDNLIEQANLHYEYNDKDAPVIDISTRLPIKKAA